MSSPVRSPHVPLCDRSIAPAAQDRRAAARPALRLAGWLAFALVFCGCGDDSADQFMGGQGMRRSIPVVVGDVAEHTFVDRIEALGTARANESIVVAAQVTETVSRVRFEDGAVVDAGAVLVELTSREESAQLREARANYEEAVRQYERAVELRRNGSLSQAQLETQTSARAAAEARLAELEARLRDRLIRAPFAGVLGMRSVSPGTLVQPGDPITTLDDIELIKVDFSVPERFLSVVEPGVVVRATTAAWPDRRFEGVVRAIDTRIDPETRSVRLRADLRNPDHALRPGMLMAIGLSANERVAFSVPEESIVPLGEKNFVFAVGEDEKAKRIELRTGRRAGGKVEVLAGLDGTERVVVEGGSMLFPGSSVEVVEETARADASTTLEPTEQGG
ncbi:MAG: efflux RND transporter periplasmic adaptor subunit [bacterium]|nr:efflux RND transporter periplasmic adaptor subunit [bacterium]